MQYRIKSVKADTVEVTPSSMIPALGEQFMLKVPRDRFEEGSQLVEGKLVKTDGYRWSAQKSFIEKLREKLSK